MGHVHSPHSSMLLLFLTGMLPRVVPIRMAVVRKVVTTRMLPACGPHHWFPMMGHIKGGSALLTSAERAVLQLTEPQRAWSARQDQHIQV